MYPQNTLLRSILEANDVDWEMNNTSPPDRQIQFLLLPGLGADHRMAHAQLILPYDVIAPDYIPMNRHESLPDYAKRFGEYLISKKLIDPARPLVLAGYSFGSAMVQEMTKHIPAKGVILIGGLKSSSELKFPVHWVGKNVSSWLPLFMYWIAGFFMAPVMHVSSGVGSSEIQLARQMYHDLPRSLFRDGYHALANWTGCPVLIPLFRIHGCQDQIITCPTPGENVILVNRAKHMVGQIQPEIVNAVIERFITDVLRLG